VNRPDTLYPWVVLATLMLVYTCGYVDRYALTIMLDQVKASLQASDAYMGFLAGPAFALFFTLASLPVARLADRHSRVLILAVGCATWSAFTLLCGLAGNKAEFTLARLGVGLGEAACLAPAYSLLADYFPPRRRALPVGFFNLSVYCGQIGGLWFGGALSASVGWRRTYFMIGAPGLLIALLFWLAVREPVRGGLDGGASLGSSAPRSFRETALWLFRVSAFRGMVAGAALATFAGMSFAYWAPAFFSRVHHLPHAAIGRNFGLIFGLSSMTGALIGGKLGNDCARRTEGSPLLIAAAGVAVATIFMGAICLVPGSDAAFMLLVPAGIATGSWLVPVQATLQDLVDARSRATAAAIFACLALIIGFLGPWAVGYLSDLWLPRFGDQTLRYAILAVLAAGFGGSAAFLVAARTSASRAAAIGR
jgi:MFS family permease